MLTLFRIANLVDDLRGFGRFAEGPGQLVQKVGSSLNTIVGIL